LSSFHTVAVAGNVMAIKHHTVTQALMNLNLPHRNPSILACHAMRRPQHASCKQPLEQLSQHSAQSRVAVPSSIFLNNSKVTEHIRQQATPAVLHTVINCCVVTQALNTSAANMHPRPQQPQPTTNSKTTMPYHVPRPCLTSPVAGHAVCCCCSFVRGTFPFPSNRQAWNLNQSLGGTAHRVQHNSLDMSTCGGCQTCMSWWAAD
jgi:hypothetical protein